MIQENSNVRFVEDREQDIHKYFCGFNELHGVTEILNNVLFYDKYTGIDADTLKNAAMRGTAIHEIIQDYLMGQAHTPDLFFADEAEKALNSWIAFEQGTELTNVLKPERVEYLVSDNVEIASKIDIVFGEGKEYALADIKTTSHLDEEYLSWQLSIYKYLFELQTGAKVSRLIALWYDRYNGSWLMKEVADKGTAAVLELIADWRNGVKRIPEKMELPAPIMEIGYFYRDIELEIKRHEEQRNEFRARLMALMKEHGIKSVKLDGFLATYKDASERKTFDTKRFMADHPELDLSEYMKTTPVAESVLIKIGV